MVLKHDTNNISIQTAVSKVRKYKLNGISLVYNQISFTERSPIKYNNLSYLLVTDPEVE